MEQQKKKNNRGKKILLVFGGLLLVTASIIFFLQLDIVSSKVSAQTLQHPSIFKGKILVASDADVLATVYGDGMLNKVAGIEDSLSLISFDNNGNPFVESSVHASSSVVCWPAIIDYLPAKNIAYIAETRGVYKGNQQQVKDVWTDFPKGSKITVVDFSNAVSPKIVQEKVIGENIQGVSINHDKTLLAAGSSEKGKEIIIAKIDSTGLITTAFYFTDKEILSSTYDKNFNWFSGVKTIEFNPTENIITVNFNNTALAFFEVIIADNNIQLKKIGGSLEVGKCWSVGNWTPNGKYFILSDVNWGNSATGAIFNGKGKLISVAFNKNGDHKIMSQVKVGLSSEGFDVSPDGHYAIVSNMRRTYVPKNLNFISGSKQASLSLVKINTETGELTNNGDEYLFDGALPEDVIFDAESNTIAVNVFHKKGEEHPTQGWVEFWEIQNDELIKTDKKVMVTRGSNTMKLIK
ncbi:MAG: hypothetical protein ABIW34_03610 [Ginsengibacter sp.]